MAYGNLKVNNLVYDTGSGDVTRAVNSLAPLASPSFTGGADFNGILTENVVITAGKLSDNTTINLENGNVFLFKTTETTTCTPNLRYNSSNTLSSKMSVGDCVSVTIVTTAAAAGYSAQVTIDGDAVTENWVGGSTPSAGGANGKDVYVYTIIKIAATGTGNNDFTVIANYISTAT